MSRHVIRTFRVMLVGRIPIGSQPLHETFKVPSNARVRVLSEQERCARVGEKDVTQALLYRRLANKRIHLVGEIRKPATTGLNSELLALHGYSGKLDPQYLNCRTLALPTLGTLTMYRFS